MSGSMHEECAVFGVYNSEQAAHLTYLGLYALQHRGQESSGIAVACNGRLNRHAGMGLVSQVFADPLLPERLAGLHAIGHNRYSTSGSSTLTNAQPLVMSYKCGQLAGAHNGNLVNADLLRHEMVDSGSIFTTTTDTEVIMHLIARSRRETLDKMILDALSRIEGAYSMVFLSHDALYGVRDPYGVRPLLLGQLNGSWFLASESCAFDLIGADIVREIEPGEMVRIDHSGVTSLQIPVFSPVERHAHCVFEFIYFSRPDSFIFGQNVDKIRRRLGRQLAREHPAPEADLVIGVPDSARTAALGYSEESGIRFDVGLIRNHYIGRTFIQPLQGGREFGVRLKFNPVKGVLRGKSIIVVDDSIVRGTTMRKIVALLRSAAPAAIHLRISSPPIIAPCFYGIDMPTSQELIGSHHTIDEIRRYLDVDTLGYLSREGVLACMTGGGEDFCDACFSGCYPIPLPQPGEP